MEANASIDPSNLPAYVWSHILIVLTIIWIMYQAIMWKYESNVLKDQRRILIEMFEAADGPNWKDKKNWGSEKRISQWDGIDVNSFGNIIRLELGNNRLKGNPLW